MPSNTFGAGNLSPVDVPNVTPALDCCPSPDIEPASLEDPEDLLVDVLVEASLTVEARRALNAPLPCQAELTGD